MAYTTFGPKPPKYKRLVIFGNTSQARLAAYYFEQDSEYEVLAFTVDRTFIAESAFEAKPLVAFEELENYYPPTEYELFIAVGYQQMNRLRASKYESAKAKGYQLASYISPRCSYLSQFEPGDNCLILEDNTIQPYVKIGNNVTLWSGNHIGHDVEIADHCFITSHVVISGFVKVGAYSFLGVNATLRDGIEIAEGSLIGAGAIIMKNTEAQGVYLPPRAKKIATPSHEIKF